MQKECKIKNNLNLLLLFYLNISPQGYATCQLDGQLGNQFFQIAHLLSFAWENDYKLNKPKTSASFNSNKNFDAFFSSVNWESISRNTNFTEYKEKHFKSFEKIKPLNKDNIKFIGFFENYLYF